MSNSPLVINHAGKRYGRLVAIQRVENDRSGNAMWLCKCDCGNMKVIKGRSLQSGATKSCGCLHDEKAAERMRALATKHGLNKHPLERVYSAMHRRCECPKDKAYKNYGARGIYVCDEWNNYVTFYEWAMQNGYARGLAIDRRDNDGPYAPWNCMWVTPLENAQNTRVCRKVKCTVLDTGEVKEFPSIKAAVRGTGVKELTIARMMDGKHVLLKGFIFEKA